eukprot:CAMPEP_0175094114 /NCGR_PEP_ID=MMETSP0086_2-20121207/3400_1 /TAXON_ID=136419 /ORGANISM="Unknown Unknown, Strain D1" /LENGTH=180 /DNA_ID=CAMNT_0016367175 /DNA_START=75 /DNA_END=618 /DNA_ORIENTATION=-
MPAEEKAQWTKKVTNQAVAAGVPAPRPQTSAAGRSTETVPLTADTVQVVLKLALNPGDDIKSEVFSVLDRDKGKVLPGCQSYEIFDEPDKDEVCVLQTWVNQEALDNYYDQPFFKEATPSFAGLLSASPDYNVYYPAAYKGEEGKKPKAEDRGQPEDQPEDSSDQVQPTYYCVLQCQTDT